MNNKERFERAARESRNKQGSVTVHKKCEDAALRYIHELEAGMTALVDKMVGVESVDLIESLNVDIEMLRVVVKGNNEHLSTLYRNLERMFWDSQLSYEECKSLIMHDPEAPWNSKDWDWNAQHAPYREKMWADLQPSTKKEPLTTVMLRKDALRAMDSLWRYGRFATMGGLSEAVYEEAGVKQIKEGVMGFTDDIALNALLVSARELLDKHAELPVGVHMIEINCVFNKDDFVTQDDTTDTEENIA